ncbi:MAG: alpha-L-fucosidase [Candidatus Hydrogenedentes bacterium]|nr:alpha-L-fucosidase [Candidatus Hydrogenedentota bacterium]
MPKPEPRIERFEKMAYGMFIHWGLYSQLGRGEWVQHMEKIPVAEYKKLKDTFTAEDFDGRAIARVARNAGMKYITLTTRHHEGFSLYDTRGLSDYDAVHSPAGRDLVADFVEGCRAEGIVPFFYHTTLDWYQESFNADFDGYLEYLRKSVEVLCTQYGEIGGLWFDGNWSKADADWKEDALYGMIRKHQPEAMIVNNTGIHKRGEFGHPEIDSTTFEQGRPEPMNREGMPKYVSAEMCQTMNRHWGIGKNDFCYMSPKEIIEHLCACRKVGANYLLNVGPTAEGKIPAYEAATLERVGDWVRMHADAVYNGKPCGIAGQGDDFGLEADGATYLFIHDLAISGLDHVTVAVGGAGPRKFEGVPDSVKAAQWVDNNEGLKIERDPAAGTFTVDATGYPYGTNTVVRLVKLT